MPKVLSLACGHKGWTDEAMSKQYDNDKFIVLCTSCPQGSYRTRWATVESIANVPNVQGGIPQVLSDYILRVQPKIARSPRYRPFPYRSGAIRYPDPRVNT